MRKFKSPDGQYPNQIHQQTQAGELCCKLTIGRFEFPQTLYSKKSLLDMLPGIYWKIAAWGMSGNTTKIIGMVKAMPGMHHWCQNFYHGREKIEHWYRQTLKHKFILLNCFNVQYETAT